MAKSCSRLRRSYETECSNNNTSTHCKELKYILEDECSTTAAEDAKRTIVIASGLVTIFTGIASGVGFLFVTIRDWFFSKDQPEKSSKKSNSKKAKGGADDEESSDDEEENVDK